MGGHTTYLLSGSLPPRSPSADIHRTFSETDDGLRCKFSVRRRYSDFEWLRKALVLQYPGIFIPPMPKKQTRGRFKQKFIENRRAGLEEYMRRLLRRRELACDSSLLRRFLRAVDDDALE